MKKIVTLALLATCAIHAMARSYNLTFPSVQGYAEYWTSYTSQQQGWSCFNETGTDSTICKIADELFYDLGYEFATILDGDSLHIFSTAVTTNINFESSYSVLNIFTGEYRKCEIKYDKENTYLYGGIYDKIEKTSFVLTRNKVLETADPYDTNIQLQRFDVNTHELTAVSTYNSDEETPRIISYCPADGQIYCITSENNWGTINKTTGELNIIAKLEATISSLVYSTRDNVFLGSYANYNNKKSYLHKIAPSTGNVTTDEINRYKHWLFWVNPLAQAAPLSPLVPDIFVDFDKETTQGSLHITMPHNNHRGDAIADSPIKCNVYIDGSLISEVEANPGETVRLPLELAEGQHKLGIEPFIVTENDTATGALAQTMIYIGADIPTAPKNIFLSPGKISWDAVGQIGANNGYVNQQNIKYIVYLNGTQITESPIAETSTDWVYDSSADLRICQAHVVAVDGTNISAKSASNQIYEGSPKSIPLTWNANLSGGEAIVVDADNDGNKWVVDNIGRGMRYYYSGETTEDWFFTPPINFDLPGTFYKVSTNPYGNFEDDKVAYDIAISNSPVPDSATVLLSSDVNVGRLTGNELSFCLFIPESSVKSFAVKPVFPEGLGGTQFFIGFFAVDYATELITLEGTLNFRKGYTRLNWSHEILEDSLTFHIKNFNIYRDGKLTETVDGKTFEYTDSVQHINGVIRHKYNVSLCYEYNGETFESPLSNTIEVSHTGIDSMPSTESEAVETDRHDLYGRRLNRPSPGVNIVRMSDGSIRKEFVK